jgi:hypothetical protein
MRYWLLPALLVLSPLAAHAGDKPASNGDPNAVWNQPAHWQAQISASTSGVINGIVMRKPQLAFDLSGRKNDFYFGAHSQTAESYVGTDYENRFFVGYTQQLNPVSLRYQVTWKTYPGTPTQYTDQALDYQVTASRNLMGLNTSLGVEYTDEDYTTIRKSYGLNLSLGRSLIKKMYGWLSVSHKHNTGSVDYTNTNIGVAYQLTDKIGVSTSVNNWHAYADWAEDHPTFSISINRKL